MACYYCYRRRDSPIERQVSAYRAMRALAAPTSARSPVLTAARRPARCRAAVPSSSGHELASLAADEAAASLSIEANADLVALAAAEARFALAQQAVAEFNAETSVPVSTAALDAAEAAVEAARAEYALVERQFAEARAAKEAAERQAGPLSFLSSRPEGGKWTEDVDEDAERVESGKAAAIAGVAATLAAGPLTLSTATALGTPEALLSAAAVFASGALFGIVFRYALRRDVNNPHLRGGVVAAFGLVRGCAQGETLLLDGTGLAAEKFAQAALLAGESVLVFALAGAALDVALSRSWLSTFPKKRDV